MWEICVGSGLSPWKFGGRRPSVRSFHFTVIVVGVLVSGMTLNGAAQLPSYSLPPLGTHVPQVARPSAVCALSTSWRRSVTFMVTDAGDGAAPAAPAVNVPLMSNERPVNIDTSQI